MARENETPVRATNYIVPKPGAGDKKSKHLINRIFFKIVYIIKLFLAFLLVLILVPVLLLSLSPLYVFRYIISKSSRLLHPDLGKIMTSRSVILGTDTIYKNPKCVIVSRIIFEGDIDIEKLAQNVQEAWIEGKNKDGLVEYPELCQYVTTWMGYLFWKQDKNFDIKNHIKLHRREDYKNILEEETSHKKNDNDNDDNCIESEDVDVIVSHLVSKSFDKIRSPWEVIVMNNYYESGSSSSSVINKKSKNTMQNPKSLLLLRWHHSLMDGLSSFQLLSKITTLKLDMVQTPDKPPPDAHVINQNFGQHLKSFFSTLWFVFRAPYEAIAAPLESFDRNSWHLPESQLSRESYFFITDGIPFQKLYELKSNYQVTFSAIVYSLITGAMRKFMRQSMPREKIPTLIHAGLSFPFPQHPEKLRNHMSICTSKLPVGIEDPIARLYFMDRHLSDLKASTVPAMSFHLVPFIGCLPLALLKGLVRNNNTTLMLSNMPGPREKIQFSLGQQWLDWVYVSGHGPGNVGISIFALTYNGTLKFCVMVDSSLVLNKSIAQELSKGILDEIATLENLYNSPQVDV